MSSPTTNNESRNKIPIFNAKSACQRLADSRKKLVNYMSQGASDTHLVPLSEESEKTINSGEPRQSKMISEVWNLTRLGFSSWWRHHPANIAIAITTPLLHRYAEKKPLQLLIISASAGIAIVILKPWRLVSIGGLALATLKSSEFSNFVASLLKSKDNDAKSVKITETSF